MGQTPSEYPRSLESCAAAPTIARPIPVGDGAMLLRRRPDVRRAERILAAATANIDVARADLYPKITIGGTAGTAAAADHAMTPSSFGFSIGPLLSWSFPNRNRVRARIDQAGTDAEGALAGFDGSVLAALRQVETALSAYARATERLRDLERAAEAAGRASEPRCRNVAAVRANTFHRRAERPEELCRCSGGALRRAGKHGRLPDRSVPCTGRRMGMMPGPSPRGSGFARPDAE